MKGTLKIICLLIAFAMTVALIPASVMAVGAVIEPLSDFTDYYGRNALKALPNSDVLLCVYDRIAAGVEASEEMITVYDGKNNITVNDLQTVLDAYTRDYAHHFWLGKEYQYSYNSQTVVDYYPGYIMSGETLENAKTAFTNEASEILSLLNESMSDYEKELVIHDELVQRIVYDDTAANAHNAYGALVDGKAVCEGYAEAFQYLLHCVGIQSFLVLGSSRGEGHEWNAVRINDKYYHVDPTWDDQDEFIFHAYFNMSDEMIKEDHGITATEYPMPECTSVEDHYFTVNGMKVTSGECTVEGLVGLMRGNTPYVHVFVSGDVTAFLQWYYDNIRAIAIEIGVIGKFSYGYSTLGREAILVLDGEIPEPEPEPEPEYAMGDVNGDGGITNGDVLVIFRHIYDPELYPINVDIGDVNHDGVITNADVLAIFRYIYDPELYPIS